MWDGYMADPAAVEISGVYYAYGTDGPGGWAHHTTGRIFPILRSPDLRHWEFVGGALTPPAGFEGADFWAPEVVPFHDGCAMVYSCGRSEGEGHKLRIAFAAHPEGPFEDAGIVLFPDEPFTIDGHLFKDPVSGKWALFYAKDFLEGDRPGTGIGAVGMRDDLLATEGEPVVIQRATGDWQIYERERFWYDRKWPAWHTVEGPFVTYRNGRYHLYTSGGLWKGVDYGVLVASSDHLFGPYDAVDAHLGPNLLRGSTSGLRGAGHNSVVQGPDGEDYLVFHAWDEGLTKRQMYVEPLGCLGGATL